MEEHELVTLIAAVDREVTGEGDARVVVASRTYPAPIDDAWSAVTDPERIPRWFLPVSGDLRPGGRYQLEGNAGGEILVCDRPGHLAVTWEYGDEVSRVEVRLQADGPASTRLRLEHTAPLHEDRWREYGPGAVGIGWELTLAGLGLHLAGLPIDREAWQTAPWAQDFVRRSSEAWGDASVAGGTPEDDARAAAARTTAAYLGG